METKLKKNSGLSVRAFANLTLKGYGPHGIFEDENGGVFLTFSVYSQQVCDVQPGWFLWGETSPGSSATSEEAKCYSFCPTEWQRQAKYLLINLPWCRLDCWLSINRVYLVCAKKPSPSYHRTAHISDFSHHSDPLSTWLQHLKLTLANILKTGSQR